MAHTSNCNASNFGRRLTAWLATAVFLFAAGPLFAQTTVTNSATATPPSGLICSDVAGNPTCVRTATDTDTVVAPQLTITKTASATSFTVGTAASYTLSVQNTGTAATTAASTITDAIPAGLTIGTLPAGCTAAGQTVTCTAAAGLAAAASTSFVIPVTPTLAAGTSVANTATVSGGGDATCPANARCTSTVTTPVNAPQLTITKTASATSFIVGTAASYTLQVSNTGTAATTAASTVTDTIPTGLTIGTLPAGCTAVGQTVTCTVAAGLAAAVSTSFVIPVTPTLAAGTSVANTATVSGGGDATCPANARCTSTVTTPVNAPQLTITKTASTTSFTVGTAASYTLSVQNTGTAVTTAASTITDTIPTGLTIGTLPAGCTAAGQTVTCTFATGLAAGASTSFVIPVTPTLAAGTSVANTATVSGGGDATCPANARCTSTVTTPVDASADLVVTKSVDNATPEVGSNVTFTVTLSNLGPSIANAVTVSDLLPAGYTYVSHTATVGTYLPGTGVWSVGNVLVAGSAALQITATVNATGPYLNTATATSTTPDPVPGNNTATATTTPTTSPVLTVVKTASAASFSVGVPASYTIQVSNSGTSATSAAATVTDAVPTGLLIGTLPAGCAAIAQDVTCTIASGLAASASVSFVIPVTAQASIGGTTVSNTALVSGGGDAGCPAATARCSSTVSTPVVGVAAYDFCPIGTSKPIFSLVNGARISRYEPGAAGDAFVPELDFTVAGDVNGMMVDPVRNRLLFVSRSGSNTILWAFDAANGGWYQAATPFASPDFPRAGMSATGVGYLIAGGSATPQVWRINASTAPGSFAYTVALLGNLSYDFAPSDLGSGDIAFDAGGAGWISAGRDLYKVDVTTLQAIRQTQPLLNGSPSTINWAGVAYAADGTLYLASNGAPSRYFGYNPATGVLTQAAPTTANASRDLASCAFPVQAVPQLSAVKSLAQVNGINHVAGAPVKAGDTLTYAIAISNTGGAAATLYPGEVVETLPANTTVVTTGNSFTCSGSNCPNTAAVNVPANGNVTLNFIVQVVSPFPTSATASIVNAVTVKDVDCAAAGNDCEETTAVALPALTLDKTTTTTVYSAVGQVIPYSYLVTNSGNVALTTAITVNDNKIVSPNTVACPALPPGGLLPTQSITCTASYTVTQADLNAGTVVNVAIATDGTTTSPSDTVTVNATQTPALTLDKTTTTPSYAAVGDVIAYSYLVTNSGNVTLTAAISVNDNKIVSPNTVACPALPPGGLLPTQSITCTASYTVTQADLNAGTVVNVATATDGTTTSPSDTVTVTATLTSSLTIDKTAGTPSGSAAGSTIAYSFLVTNTGNVTLTGIAVNDALLDAAAVCAATTLLPSATTTCTGTHTITQAEVNAGTVNNSATATGTPPGGGTTTSPPDTTNTPIAPTPSLTIDKTAGTPSGSTAGSTIAYSFLVTNTGNVTLTGIAVNDALLDAAAVCPVTTLAPAASTTCTGTHTITQAEVNAGTVNNSATATGTPPGGGTTTSPPDTTNTPIAPAPSLTIDKSAGTPSGSTAGSTIAYSFLVTNTGNVTLTGIVVNDALLDAAAVCPVTTLLPSASTTCTGTHTITQAEVNAGTVNNSATATGTPPGGGTTTSPPDTTNTPIAPTPSLTIDKTAGTPSGSTAGSTIAYTFLVTNTGNVTLTGIAVNDALLDAAAVCPVTTLAPAASTTCTGTHTITQAEVNAGTVNNSATATGTPPGGGTTTSPPDTTNTPIAPTPSLTIDKTAGTPSGSTAGSTIAYTFLVTNTGNVTLTGIVINDALLDAPATCPVTTLAPAASTTCTGTHTITQAEVNAGTVNNSATATGTPPGGGTTTSPPDTTNTPIASAPSLTIDKTAGTPSGSTAGSTIAYTFLVTNTGNVTLTGIAVNDALLDSAAACPVTTLLPAASTTCTGTHTITQAEVNAGTVNNSATATGTPPGGGTTTSPPDTTNTPIAPGPSLTIDKTAGTPSGSTAGSTIAYSFLVTNTGNVTLTGIVVNDALLDAAATCPVTTLAPAASTTCTGTHTITQAEVNAGTVNNSATATGTPPGGGTTTSPPDTTNTPIASAPSLTIDKTAGTPSGSTAGSTIAYSFLVTNTGNVTLTGIVINDALLDAAAVCPATTLLPGASTTCTGTHTITQAEVNAGTVDNSATATGTPPGGGTTTSPPDTTNTPITSAPSLTIDKTAGTPSGSTAGSTIAYSFLVTNTGNVTLTGIAVNDALLDAAAVCPVTTLLPGASTTCTGTHTITQDEVNAGTVNNSATATGTPPGGGTTTSPPDTTNTPITATPSLTIDKTAGTPSGSTAGSTIAYSFLVTNTGNVTLTGIAVNDALLDAAAVCPVTTLIPGASTTCTGTHTITQAEVNAGTVNNSATATGTPPGGGTTTSPPDTTNTPITATPSLTIDKTAGTPSGSTAGSTIAYTFLVTNTGNVTLTGIVINDALLDAPATCPVTTLAPAASTTCTGTHTITQAEVNAGTVNNSATATGTPPGGGTTTSPPDTTNTPIVPTPSLTIDKTAGTPSGSTAGSTIAYTFLVTNTGNVTVTAIAVVDANLDAAAVCPVTTLLPGASTTCTGTHTITQAEVNAGTVNNSATATGTPPGGGTTTSPPDTTNTPIASNPSLTLDKTATVADTNGNGVVGDAGDTISYSFSVTNTGNVTLAPVTVADPLLPALACSIATLAPGATASCVATGNTYVITTADAAAGTRANTATATGDAPGNAVDPTASDTATVTTQTLLIDAVDDDYSGSPVNGAVGGNTPSVLVNDTLNGAAVTVGTGGNVALTPGTSPNPGLVMNPDGTITIAPGTAAGTYVYPYTICEVLNPANCDTANATVVVGVAPIVAVDDTNPVPVNGGSGGIAITDIFANDTLNGLPVERADIVVTNTTVPPQLVFDPATGSVSVVPGSPAGTYTFDYTICELLNPSNCATALVTVLVEASLIEAIDDSFPPVNGGQGGTTTTVIVNDTLNGQPITLGTGGNATLTPGSSPLAGLSMNPDGTITIAPGTPAGTYQYPYTICEVLNPRNCDTAIATVIVGAAVIDAVDDTFPSVNGENGGNTATVLGNDTLNGVPVTLTTVTLAPGTSPNPGLVMNPDGTITIVPGTAAGTYTYPYTICEVLNPSNCDVANATVVVVSNFALRVLKTAAVREVKIGDLVRYTVTVENVGTSNLVDGSLLDTPAPGFSYVEGSLTVVDGNNMATATGQSPIRFDGLDIAAGDTATLMYAMRVGAGVRPGVQINEALAVTRSGQPISNVSRAAVTLVADALVDDSLLIGTVFDDRDGDGWQDSAALDGVHVQGGFAPTAYVPNSTTVDRGAGPRPEADASAPMLHGIDVGAITPRQSTADPVTDHQVVIHQRLSELAFTSDFVLTSAQGVTVRMDAAGNTSVEKSGDAAKGLNAAEPKVERRVAQGEGGYLVDYVISNLGIDDRGIPGVRIASVEGLLIETDQFGRYHLEGIAGGDTGRGRNFILKVDPSTLPPGTVFTTDNPLVRRITPGVPVRFDFGVKLPVEEIQGGEQQVELELGEVIFAPGSAKLREEYLPVVDRIAAKVTEYRGGEVLVSANGDSQTLAFDRATAVKTALLGKLPADIAAALTVSVRAEADDPSSMVVGIAEGGPLLGTVLFDTDKSTVKPQFLPVLDKVAGYLSEKGGGSVAIVGHADPRASDAYNLALGMRRAKAVYEVLAAKLSPEVRARVRVESSNDPAAPAGSK